MGETIYLGKNFAFFEAAVEYVEGLLVPEPASGLLSALAISSAVVVAGPRKRGTRP
jgi:hypothetical protein